MCMFINESIRLPSTVRAADGAGRRCHDRAWRVHHPPPARARLQERGAGEVPEYPGGNMQWLRAVRGVTRTKGFMSRLNIIIFACCVGCFL